MDSKAVLEKAIQKAIDGGWINYEDFKPVDLGAGDVGLEYGDSAVVLPSCMIFQHQFAKALWGNGEHNMSFNDYGHHDKPSLKWICLNCLGAVERENGITAPCVNWKVHLQRMVIADDPIKYLGQHLTDKGDV